MNVLTYIWLIGLATLALCGEATAADKTLMSWVTLANTTQQGGSALTILCGRQFDGIVFGEKAAGRWMAGSETFARTQGDQQGNAVEKADSKTLLQMAASADRSNEQAMFFRTRPGQNGWDSWWFYHEGTYYQYVLSGPNGNWTAVTLLTSPDACHWKDCGEVVTRTPVAIYLGSGGVWKSPDFARDKRFIMNVSEQYPPNAGKWPNEQIIFFLESKDLVHWQRLPDECVFRADDRWYERLGGRWDCIYAIPRAAGGYFGYWTGFPKSGSGRAFGQSTDGVHWEALKPVECPEKAEVAAVEPMAGKYYMISQGRKVFIAEQPEGPFRAAAKNADVFSGAKLPNSTQVVTPFPRFFRKDKEVFIISYGIAVHEPGFPSYCLPLNVAHVDQEGTLRATYWKGNDAMKERPVPVKLVAAAMDDAPRMIEQKIAVRDGCILEATCQFAADDASTTPCLFIDCENGERVAIKVHTNGMVEMGMMSKDGKTLEVRHQVNRLIPLGKSAQVRLMLKDSLFAVYLNDVAMDYFPMSSLASGRLGVSSSLSHINVWTTSPSLKELANGGKAKQNP